MFLIMNKKCSKSHKLEKYVLVSHISILCCILENISNQYQNYFIDFMQLMVFDSNAVTFD